MYRLLAKAAFVEALAVLTTGPGHSSPPYQSSGGGSRLFATPEGGPTPPPTPAVVPRAQHDPIANWTPPPRDAVRRVKRQRVDPLRTLTSPVFFSTDARTGRRHRGLSRIPSPAKCQRPMLFVSNHQLAGVDSWMVVSELLEERDIFLRSLVHPIVYENDSLGAGGADRQFIRRFGAVRVSPKNLYRLMETGQPALLFPGGARESFHGRDDAYTLSAWPDGNRTDFVRIAAKFDATIVPFSSVGASESAIYLADPPDRSKVPFGLDDVVFNLLGDSAPFDARYDNGQMLTFPLVLPKPIPSRHCFLFHRPISTSGVDHRDRERCREVYDKVKMEIRKGIDDLLVASKKDPFRDSARRILYERIWRRQAPTFSVNELN